MKTGLYRDLFPIFLLLFTFSCTGEQVAKIPQSAMNPRCLWVYGKPTTFFIDEDEKEEASFITLDQLEQLKEVGLVIQSKLDDKKYFIKLI